MAFRVEIVGVAAKRASLQEFIADLEDMSGLWERYGEIMASTEAEWFASNGDGMWPPLAEDTLKDKFMNGYPPETLIRTGDLLESLTNPAEAMEVGQGRSTLGTFTAKAMSYGTSVRDERGRLYAHYHQHTSPVTGEPMDYGERPPLRQVIPMPLPAATEAEMLAADEDWLEDCVRRSGLS